LSKFNSLIFAVFALVTSQVLADKPATIVIKDIQYEITTATEQKRLRDEISNKLKSGSLSMEQLKTLFDGELENGEKIDLVILASKVQKKGRGRRYEPKAIEARIEKNLGEFQKKYAIKLKAYIDGLVSKHRGTKLREKSSTIYHLPQGIEFFADYYNFANENDPYFRAMALTLFSNSRRMFAATDFVEKLAVRIRENFSAQTRVLPVKNYSAADMSLLVAMHEGRSYRFEQIGDVWVLGAGFGYNITRKIVRDGQSLKDPVLKKRFERVLDYHMGFGIPVIHDYSQGAAAYYNPGSNEMAFVIPSAGTLNSYTHEITHSRFNKFTNGLEKWMDSRQYVAPYQVTGPPLGVFAATNRFGGLFNLLNEVNSWRTGESFDGKNSDADILKTLVNGYGEQSGYEATAVLEKFWTADKLADKSVPYLIYHEIESFNERSLEDHLLLGLEGAEKNDFLSKMNFLIMFEAKKFSGTKLEEDARYVVDEIAKAKNEPSIISKLGDIDPRYKIEESQDTKIDLSKSSREEVLKEFAKTGSDESKKLILDTFLDKLEPKDLDPILERAVQSGKNPYFHEAIEVLTALFDRLKWSAVVKDAKATRQPIVDSVWMQALDVGLAKHLYNGGIASKRIKLMNLIMERIHPNEVPLTYAKTLDLLGNSGERPRPDVWVARLVMMPVLDFSTAALFWGEKLIKDLRGNSNLRPGILEAMGWFYRMTVANALAGKGIWLEGKYARTEVQNVRLNTLRTMNQYSSEDSQRLEVSSLHLWQLAADKTEVVRVSALYAMMTNPAFLIRNEGRIMQAQYSRDPRYSAAIEFLMDSSSEYLPKAKRLYEIQSKKAAQSGAANICSRSLLH
jgi:hypothetical protein